MTSNVVLYVGCGLTQAPEWFQKEVTLFKGELRSLGFKVLEFVGVTDGTSLDVWKHDLSNVDNCTHMIGIVDENSTGLGIELGRARWYKNQQKPVLCLQRVGGKKVTRMISGGVEAGEFVHGFYKSRSEAIALVMTFLSLHPVSVSTPIAAE